VLIQVEAAAMNHLDLWVRRGLPIEMTMPHIGGADFAGTIVEVGGTVNGPGGVVGSSGEDRDPLGGWPRFNAVLPAGSRVVVNPALSCGQCRECRRGEESLCRDFRIIGEHLNGGFAEYAVVPASNVYAIPDGVDFQKAACLPVSYQTAWRAVVARAGVRSGEDVLVVGASGGTAIAIIQVARLSGARVFAVTSGADNMRRLRELGAEFVFDRESEDWSRTVKDATEGRGVDVVFDSVGAAALEKGLHTLAPGGRLVTYGATSGPKVEIDLRRVFWRQLEIIGTTMASRAEFEAMLRAAWAGRLEPVIDSVLPLAEARSAHERLEAGKQFGKVVLRPG
jgi:NADPH:quinone reductase-like Zn-dependent oxidoreductase